MRLKCVAFAAVTVTVANGSLNLGLDRFKSLPNCNSGISKQQKEIKFVIEEEKNCRWRVPKELIRGRQKIKLFEIKTDCVESEDQLFMLDGEVILGPFCHDFEYSSNYKDRHRRGATRDSTAHEVRFDPLIEMRLENSNTIMQFTNSGIFWTKNSCFNKNT
jgi:hypothetical protein